MLTTDPLTASTRGRWVAVHHCANCEHILDMDERFYSGGVCPFCGFDSHSTICNTKNRPVWVAHRPWWQWIIERLAS